MERDPASMVPILATKEGRKEMQVSTLSGVLPNLIDRLQAGCMPLLDVASTVAPLLEQLKAPEIAAMPVREKPELLWVWWLVNSNSLQMAKDDWAAVDPKTMGRLAFDWMWLYAPFQKLLKSNKDNLEIPMNRFIEKLPPRAQRSVWELSQEIATKEPTDSQQAKLIKAWRTLFSRLDITLSDMMEHCRSSLPRGASPAFLECAQKASQKDILELVNHHPTGFVPLLHEFSSSNCRELTAQPWKSPLGGLALLTRNPLLTATALTQHPDTQPIMGMLDCLGLGLNDIGATRQLINAMNAPTQESVVIESQEMGALLAL